ncbi:MAG: hypothetical protein OXC07_01455 [Kistimonas sp.]|nr:hypothetical protein [Kistimonas sp.]
MPSFPRGSGANYRNIQASMEYGDAIHAGSSSLSMLPGAAWQGSSKTGEKAMRTKAMQEPERAAGGGAPQSG